LVGGMTRAQLAGYMAENNRAPAMVVVAAGAVEHERIVNLAAQAFADSPPQQTGATEGTQYVGGERREMRDLDQVHLALGFPGVAYGDANYYATQVYATVLGGGMSSRLFQEVRENRGLAYSVFSFSTSYRDGGLFTIYAGTGAELLDRLVPVIGEELHKAALSVSEEELARAQAQLKVGLLMSLESSSARIEQLGRQMLIHGRPLPIEEVIAAVDAVDCAAVRSVAGRLLRSGPPSIAAIGPIGKLENYQRMAARFSAA
jgi:predicted Zn-dependent peptidase